MLSLNSKLFSKFESSEISKTQLFVGGSNETRRKGTSGRYSYDKINGGGHAEWSAPSSDSVEAAGWN